MKHQKEKENKIADWILRFRQAKNQLEWEKSVCIVPKIRCVVGD